MLYNGTLMSLGLSVHKLKYNLNVQNLIQIFLKTIQSSVLSPFIRFFQLPSTIYMSGKYDFFLKYY